MKISDIFSIHIFTDDSLIIYNFFRHTLTGISLPNGTIGVDHPMHLHGHHFWILKQGSYDELQEPNYYLNTVINPNNPEYTTRPNHRDTVSVPAAGFAVVRFVADNPGTCG